MLFLIIQLLLAAITISVIYFVFLWALTIDFSFLPTPLDGLAIILTTFFVSYILIILVLALINKLSRLLLKDKLGELTGFDLILWTIKETAWDITKTITQKIIVHSIFPVVVSRLFGFTPRKGTSILGNIYDPELIEIGEGTLFGTFAIVSGHHIRRGSVYRNKTIIGKNCTVGAYTIIAPGAKIEDNVLVGACSFIPANWVLEANSIYSGVPVKKVKSIDPSEFFV
jgi:hypothetical protein